jgi:hypothetical protein
MGPDTPLPLPAEFDNVDDYVESLLEFTTSSWLLQTLCGGVHILDFYTKSPDLYASILPQTWREWFKDRDIMVILDLLMREDLNQFDAHDEKDENLSWRGGPAPPKDLLEYLKQVRKHLLGRAFPPPNSGLSSQKSTLARHVATGMKVKKIHEVDNFARYLNRLTTDIAAEGKREITHLVDFGSGQNYLGRALAATPYSKHIVAVESRPHNIEGAKNMDVLARLVPKPLVLRNKKEHRAGQKKQKKQEKEEHRDANGTVSVPVVEAFTSEDAQENMTNSSSNGCNQQPALSVSNSLEDVLKNGIPLEDSKTSVGSLQIYSDGRGSVQYVEHMITDGDLAPVVSQIVDSSQVQDDNITSTSKAVEEPSDINTVPKLHKPNLMVMSLHSCGNLVHHGLRSLLLNPAVSAVAMVGCCYNLVTERLGPPTYKLPSLRPKHPRLEFTSNTCDPNGFPMSEKLATYPLPYPPGDGTDDVIEPPKGIRMNITARMMAVQAPQNWAQEDSDLFFTRHFYRALLQRIFLDRGVVAAPVESVVGGAVSANGHTSKVNWTPPNGRGPGLSSNGTATPLTIGSLRKFAYKDFPSYVRAAIGKLTSPNTFCEVDPEFIAAKMEGLTDDDIRDYEVQYGEKKKELNIMWSLMAFSAGVVEAIIVTDRYLWLKEQAEVETAWVEPVFEYGQSPRNLVVVGIKK